MSDIFSPLREIFGEKDMLVDSASLQSWGQDWTRFYEPKPSAIVFVRSAEQIQQLVELARQQGIGLVPSGGRTGLSGGAVANRGEVVVSFDKMNQILDFNEVDQSLTVQAGVVTARIQEFALDRGLQYPVDFASSGSSQIGGNIATNAGGIKVIKYGLTRQWVTGLKVVTGRGDILDLNRGLIKNATGVDLRHLFIGSEGTLGFITEATISLARPAQKPRVILIAVPELTAIAELLVAFQAKLELAAFEFFSDKALTHVMQHREVTPPFADRTPYYALIEVEGYDQALEDVITEIFESCLSRGICSDAVISQSHEQAKSLWLYREAISESITPHTPYKNDVSVRPHKVADFLVTVEALVNQRYPDFEIVWFGHIGDGNLHLNILKPNGSDTEGFKRQCESVSEDVMRVVQDYGGSVSAEHGVGLLKRNQIGYSRSSSELDYLRIIKSAFDPDGILNPGKMFPDSMLLSTETGSS